ncbi:MAG: hypothetical protein AAF430_00460 [Myxococcota bacterium]
MGRFMIMMMAGGGLVAWLGWQELTVSQGATELPMDISLSELESGSVPENPHLRIGDHYAMHHELVFSYRTERSQENEELGPEQKLDYAYYPIVAVDNRFIQEWMNLEKLYGDAAEIPEEQYPDPVEFTVLVRTERFKTFGSLPDAGWNEETELQGLVVNKIRSLTGEEKALVGEGFPNVDLAQVLLLEEGRQPASATKSFAMMGGGAFVAVLPLVAMARSRSRAAELPATAASGATDTPDSPEGRQPHQV